MTGLGGGYELKDVIERMDRHFELLSQEIKTNREVSDSNDKKQGEALQRIEEHVKHTNGKVAKNLLAIAELQTYKADNTTVQTIRKYSIGNYVRDNPLKFFGIITGGSGLGYGLIEAIKKLFG